MWLNNFDYLMLKKHLKIIKIIESQTEIKIS